MLSMPLVIGCSFNNGEYLVRMDIDTKCPVTEESSDTDNGWDKIVSNDFPQTHVKLLKAVPSDNVDAVDWKSGAISYMKKEGGSFINVDDKYELAGIKGVKTTAMFSYGVAVLVDIPLKNNNLFEIISKNESEANQVLSRITSIEELYASQ